MHDLIVKVYKVHLGNAAVAFDRKFKIIYHKLKLKRKRINLINIKRWHIRSNECIHEHILKEVLS